MPSGFRGLTEGPTLEGCGSHRIKKRVQEKKEQASTSAVVGSLVTRAPNTGGPGGVPEGGTTEDASPWWPSAIRNGRVGPKPHGRRRNDGRNYPIRQQTGKGGKVSGRHGSICFKGKALFIGDLAPPSKVAVL